MKGSLTRKRAVLAVFVVLIAGCASAPHGRHGGAGKGGGYYQNDGPPENTDIDPSQIPDAVPKNVPLSRYGNPTSYTALGKRYYVLKSAAGFTQTGRASWYGRQFDGGRTSSGAPYNMFAMTAAHKRLPIPTWVRVTNLDNHRQVVVKINDRGPFHDGRIIDLSYIAARRLGIVAEGSAPVRIHTVTPATLDQSDATAYGMSDQKPPVPLRSAAKTATTTDHRSDRAQPPAARIARADTPSRSTPRASGRQKRSGRELQIGAFSSAAHASRAKAQARAAGVGPVVVVPPTAHLKLYRVRAGPFDTFSARHQARQRLADAGFPVREVER